MNAPLIALPMGIAGRHAGAPQAPFGDPGLFALGDPLVLEAVYRDAGFRDVTVVGLSTHCQVRPVTMNEIDSG